MHSMHHSCYDCERLAHVLLPSGRWAMACVTNLDEHERHGHSGVDGAREALVVMAAEGIPGIQHAILRQVQVMGVDELLQIRRAHMRFLRGKGILQIKAVDAELIGHHHIGFIRHPLCHPMMSADGLQPPDFISV